MNNNPFVLPGFGQAGPMGQNPILASMEMMRQAWDGLASSGGMDPSAMGRMMSVEEMDKRIADLRAVENWLRMNLSMLSSTIQGLEVQRATVATLKSFVETGMAAGTPSPARETGEAPRARPASPLDEVLGIRPGADGTARQAAPEPAPSAPQAPEAGADGAPESDSASQAGQSDILTTAASATQGWWNLLQQQFQTLAAATAASAEGALADFAEAGKAAAETQAAAAASVAQPARKTAARKATARKTVAKTAAKGGAATSPTQAPAAGRATAKTAAKAARKAGSARKTTS